MLDMEGPSYVNALANGSLSQACLAVVMQQSALLIW